MPDPFRFLACLCSALAAAYACAQPAQRAAAAPDLCQWFIRDDRLTWEAVTPETAAEWEAAVSLLARRHGVSEAVAADRLAQACRERLARGASVPK